MNGNQPIAQTDIRKEPWRWASSKYKPTAADVLALQNPNPEVDITGGRPVGEGGLGAMLEALTLQNSGNRAMAAAPAETPIPQSTNVAAAPTPTATPKATPSSDDAFYNMLTQMLNPQAPPVAQAPSPRDVDMQQRADASMWATAAEDAAINRATAHTVVNREFGGAPPLGETFTKMLPEGRGKLTAFPSGGYAITGGSGSYKGRPAEPLLYGSRGTVTDVGYYNKPPPQRPRPRYPVTY